jgi:hypothetical protein
LVDTAQEEYVNSNAASIKMLDITFLALFIGLRFTGFNKLFW